MSDKDKDKLNKMYCDKDSNNFDQKEESLTDKDKKKKHSHKNKPFQGHGIGYHQGKALVIKLPMADTRVISDLPFYPTYDFYSKMLRSEYLKQNDFENKFKDIQIIPENINIFSKDHEISVEPFSPEITTEKSENISKNTDKVKETESNTESTKKADADPKQLDRELDDVFERLRKIIKTHVYPSRSEDFNPYKVDKQENKEVETTTKSSTSDDLNKNQYNNRYKTDDESKDIKKDNNKYLKNFNGFEKNLEERLASMLKDFSYDHSPSLGKTNKYKGYNKFIYDRPYIIGHNENNKYFPSYSDSKTEHIDSPFKYFKIKKYLVK